MEEQTREIREIKLTPNFRALHEHFFGEFQSSVKAAIRDGVVDDEYDSLEEVREALVYLNISIQNIDSLELFVEFRPRLHAIVDELVAAHDKLKHDQEMKGKCPECAGDLDSEGTCLSCNPTEPQEEDLVTYDGEHFFSVGSYSTFDVKLNRNMAFTFDDGGDNVTGRVITSKYTLELPMPNPTREDAIRAFMDKEQFFPNVWTISDDGDSCLIDLSREVKA